MNNVVEARDNSISLVRLCATAMIVVCHFMQYSGFVLAWWLNVGVQIFLCMSGYLYGKRKQEKDEIGFYKRQFTKILIDYYVVIILVIGIQLIVVPSEVSLFQIAKSIVLYGTLSGGEHLWYIPYILLCYFLTPFYNKYFDWLNQKQKDVSFFFGTALLLLINFILFNSYFRYFNSAWINCYIIGMFIGRCELYGKQNLLNTITKLLVCLTILMNAVQIYINYFSSISISNTIQMIYSVYSDYAHVALGCTLFVLLRFVFKQQYFKNINVVSKICKTSDKLSYDIYLVHQFLILGPLSMMGLTGSVWVDIVLILVVILIAAVLLNYVSRLIRKMFV